MVIKYFLLLLAGLVGSCASTTMLRSVPSGAKVYVDGSVVGKTPYAYSDTKIIGSTTAIQMKKDGCEPWSGILTRSETFQVGPCIGGVFVLIPFLWVMGYNPEHTYELECKTQSSVKETPMNLISEMMKPTLRTTSACAGIVNRVPNSRS